ncbi:MAG: 30S ribosomal protein S6 [Alphaproteobacteria bacterium]|nr:30S ribosomal protein S6 [Alphaproteobacteria bacterium]
MDFYETVFIARQDVTSSQVEAMTLQYTSLIKDNGGDITKTEFCGLRPLAYTNKKNKKGHYVLLNISVDSKWITEMERQMKNNENILRYLTVKVEELDNNPSALMQQRHYREEQYHSYGDAEEETTEIVVETEI